jgi:hypothetical protein
LVFAAVSNPGIFILIVRLIDEVTLCTSPFDLVLIFDPIFIFLPLFLFLLIFFVILVFFVFSIIFNIFFASRITAVIR